MTLPQKLAEYATNTLIPIDALAPAPQARLLEAAELLFFPIGATLFEQGDEDDHVLYLIAGRLDILAVESTGYRIDAGTEEARYPLANLRPRQYSATAVSACQVLSLPKRLFDDVIAGQKSPRPGAGEAGDAGGEDQGYDWMAGLLQSHIFGRMPTENILKVLSVFEEVEVQAGAAVINEGDPGDFYYLVKEGRFQVTRRLKGRSKEVALAELHEGHGFGEEALLSDGPRNASVRAVVPGRLMRIRKEDFLGLIRDPALRMVPFDAVGGLVKAGAQLLDVRLEQEVAAGALKGALHLPLHLLREGLARLDVERHYVVFCDNGTRSAIAAFLLLERGFNVTCIRDGVGAELQRRKGRVQPAIAADRPPVPPAAAASGMALEEVRHLTRIIEDRSVGMDELSRALSVVLASVYRQLEQTLREKELAEQARLDAEARLAEVLRKNVA